MLLLPLKYKQRPIKAWTEWRLLIRVAALIGCIRLGLQVLSYKRTSALVKRTSNPRMNRDELSFEERRRLIWAVRALTKRMLNTKPCLTQSLALLWLLRRRGEDVRVQIGVRKNDAGEFAAHAWLEQEGQVLIGGKMSPANYALLKRAEVNLS